MLKNKRKSSPARKQTRAEKERARKAAYAAKRRSENSNIGEVPAVTKQSLRDECENDLVAWHVKVFPHSTGLKPFCQDQLDSIAVSDDVMKNGGRVMKLEPRGFGKTTRAVQELLHAILYGRRKFGVLFASETDKAVEIFAGIKLELETNELLYAMFPEVCHPIRCAAGSPQKAKRLHQDGQPLGMEWSATRIILPTIAGTLSPGSIIAVRSIRNARGLQRRTKKAVLRPDLYILDDVQTDDGAASRRVVRKILGIIRKSILRGGGYSTTAAILKLATVIEPDDVADTIANDPAWVTVRFKFLKSPSTAEESHWLGKYADLRTAYIAGDKKSQEAAHKKALAFYKRNRKAMDAGAKAAWEWAFPWDDPDVATISAIQHYYNVLIDDGEEVAACELQNSPIKEVSRESVRATRDELELAIVPIERGIVPVESTRLVAFVDLHKNLFYYVVTSLMERQRRHVVDYGSWPEQKKRHFTLQSAKRIIPDLYPQLGMKDAVGAALRQLLTELISRRFLTMAGMPVGLDHVFFDANWGPTEKVVKRIAAEHAHAAMITPCHGRGIPANKAAIEQWRRQPGEDRGDGWIRRRQTAKAVRTLVYDTNYWKTETHLAVTASQDSPGSVTIFDGSALVHELFFDHVLSEYEHKKTAQRTVHEWGLKPGDENHYFDCLVGSIVGADVVASGATKRRTKKSATFTL